MSNPCKTCRYADWERTASGRLSPKGKGHCLWSKTVRIAASCSASGYATPGQPINLIGGVIWRNDNHFWRCDTYEKAKP